MTVRIETQSERYAHVDPALLDLTMQREATLLPTDEEVAAALQRPGIRAGQLTAKVERPGFESGPSFTGRAVTAAYGKGNVFLHDDAGHTLALDPDPDANMRFVLDRVIDAKQFLLQNLGGIGWFYDDDTGEMAQARISDFSFSDGQQDRTEEMRRILDNARTASNDPDMDLFFELSNQGMSMDDIGKEIAKRNYTDNEERKAFRKGWRSGFTGKDATHYDKLTDGWPSNLYHAFFSAYEIVRTYW